MELVSGLWVGYYMQGSGKYPQELTLEFADGLMRGDGRDGIGTFTVDGEYRIADGEVRVGWIKTYDGAHSVLYLGKLENGTITGRWNLGGMTGRFGLDSPRKAGT